MAVTSTAAAKKLKQSSKTRAKSVIQPKKEIPNPVKAAASPKKQDAGAGGKVGFFSAWKAYATHDLRCERAYAECIHAAWSC